MMLSALLANTLHLLSEGLKFSVGGAIFGFVVGAVLGYCNAEKEDERGSMAWEWGGWCALAGGVLAAVSGGVSASGLG